MLPADMYCFDAFTKQGWRIIQGAQGTGMRHIIHDTAYLVYS